MFNIQCNRAGLTWIEPVMRQFHFEKTFFEAANNFVEGVIFMQGKSRQFYRGNRSARKILKYLF